MNCSTMLLAVLLAAAPAPDQPEPQVRIDQIRLDGRIEAANITFTLALRVVAEADGQRIDLVSGELVVDEVVAPVQGYQLHYDAKTRTYAMSWPGKGTYDVLVKLAVRPKVMGNGAWRQATLTLPASRLRTLQVTCDRSDLQVQFPGALRLEREVTDDQLVVTALQGADRPFVVRWQPQVQELEAKLVATGRIATLVLAVSPFTAREIERFEAVAAKHGYDIVASPSHHPADPLLAEILAASDARSLDAAVQDPVFDYSPPTDRRPYFFNNLKPGLGMPTQETLGEGPIAGNLVAQSVLLRLLAITALLVAAIIVGPLVRLGLPSMGRLPFVLAVAYFSLIGMGFMLVQIPLMQRFSVYLGHPSLTVPIVLFSMILATGAGSFLSDRLSVDRGPALLIGIPLVCAGAIAALAGLIQPLIDHTLQQGLFVRGGLVVAVTAPVAALLGFCFPIGLRLVQRLSTEATAWMWGVNGACGVLASVFAVVISMWWGIDTSLFAGACAYALLALPAYGLRRSAR